METIIQTHYGNPDEIKKILAETKKKDEAHIIHVREVMEYPRPQKIDDQIVNFYGA